MSKDYTIQIKAIENKIEELLDEVEKLRTTAEEYKVEKPYEDLVQKFLRCRPGVWEIERQEDETVLFNKIYGVRRGEIGIYHYNVGPKFLGHEEDGIIISIEELEVILKIKKAMRG